MVGVQFNGAAGATNVSWDFDDGGFANILNPVHTFSQPGTYNVQFTGTVAGNPVQYNLTISVFGKPTPSFTTASTKQGCTPLQIVFQNNSTGSGGAPITGYSWAFGDGGVSNLANPTYSYTIGGQYSVSLIVTDANGCDSSFSINNYITASAKPLPVITTTPSPAAACVPPLNVTFSGSSSTSNSTTGSALTYSWNFGNGNTSTVVNPAVQNYTTAGNHVVTLIVTDNNNCSDSVKTTVSINNPIASFFVADTVCRFVTFDDALSSTGTQSWNYGDGFTGVKDTHTYANPGIYNVTLTVSAGGCSHDTTRTIVIQDIEADFTISPTYSCSLPQTVNLTSTSTNAYTYTWSISSGRTAFEATPATSTAQNPVVIITQKDTNMYTLWDQQTVLNITLLIETRQGCRHSVNISWKDTLYLPSARYQPDVTEGCFPLTVQFSDSSTSRETIVSWKYFFGDGTSVTSTTTGDVSHTYTVPGIYYPMLIIVNSRGCTDTSYAIPIRVGAPPSANFSISPATACVHTPIQFTDLSTASGSSPIDTWHYYTDNGFIMSHCFTDRSPSYSFESGTGPQDITLVVGSRGCYDTITKPNAVTILGPLMEFTAKMDCDSPDVFQFIGNIKDATSWTWDFGDGNVISNSTADSISHTYTTPGQYTVELIGVNSTSGCPADTFTVDVWYDTINADFVTDSLACAAVGHQFNATPSSSVFQPGNNGYTWIWGDNTPPTITSNPISEHSFAAAGYYTVMLVVKDHNSCTDTITKRIRASKVETDFFPDALFGCIPWTVHFADSSVSDTTITSWNWSFGDASTGTGDTVSHTFTNPIPNVFNVFLTVTNAIGCTDTLTKKLTPSKPQAAFFPTSNTNICAGDSVKFLAWFNNSSNDWNFGDGQTGTGTTPGHTYTTPGTYTVSLTVTDSIGCQKTVSSTGLVKVQGVPDAGFFTSVDTITERCYPLTVNFTDTSIANVFGSRVWDLGNGSPVVPNTTVGTIYQLPGNYPVSLIVRTTFGCTDTIRKVINVQGPVADFTVAPATICKGQSVEFQVKDTSGVALYHWDFGDGFDSSGVSPVSHTYNIHPANGQLSATLVFWGTDSSCAKTKTQTINIQQVIADFNRNGEVALQDTSHCVGVQDMFVNNSTNATVWQWNFGDGQTSGALSPQHTYASPGVYTVSLNIVNAQTGCVDTIRKPMIINANPVVTAVGGDTCKGSPVELMASGGVKYQWSPSTGLSNDSIANPIATPTETTTYTVTVFDANLCRGTSTAVVSIVQPPTAITWDTTVIIGQYVQLNYEGHTNEYIYTWSPTDSLSCTTCPNPMAHPMDDIKYTLTITDRLGCFTEQSFYEIFIKPETSIDVPTAFTPNGDGHNDLVFVRGWGIKDLLEFKIYNRWGELVFISGDINEGWDGTYKGVPQGTETFAYTARVETYVEGRIIEKKGFIKLLR